MGGMRYTPQEKRNPTSDYLDLLDHFPYTSPHKPRIWREDQGLVQPLLSEGAWCILFLQHSPYSPALNLGCIDIPRVLSQGHLYTNYTSK